MSKTEQELREWCEGVEADNDTLRSDLARVQKERNEFRELVSDAMRFAERCASKCEELNREAKELQRMYCHAAALIGRCTPNQIAKQQGWDCFYNDLVDANANNQDFRTTDMG